jgi:tetratricopeptide (TPR) repeat protein
MKRAALTLGSLGAAAALLLAAPSLVHAQQATQTRLQNAIARYEAFDVEGARPILLQIVSPGYLEQVTQEQRATAYKYLGASYAVLAAPDTAITYFRAALDFDPFTDLDPSKFAASELEAFNKAKSEIFKVAMRPIPGPALLRPQANVGVDSAAYTFTFISTQRSNMRIVLRHTVPVALPGQQRDSAPDQVLYSGTNDGVRTVAWRGTLNDGRFAPPGTYVITVAATPTQGANRAEETDSRTFRLEHLLEPLEDTLPSLDRNDPQQWLPQQYRQWAIWQDLAKGVFVGGVAAFAIPSIVRGDIDTRPHALGAAGLVTIGASASFLYRRRKPEIRLNVEENRRREAVRAAFNDRVRRDNNARRERTVMVMTPVTAAQ